MTEDRAAQAARWLVEAFETGDPLGPLPPEIAPRDLAEGEEVAGAVLDGLALPPCGLRLGPDGLAGPVVGGRLLADGVPVALATLRHPRASAAVVGVLAEALDPDAAGAPILAALHPALDIGATRFTEPPADPALRAADLGGLGLILLGRRIPGAAPGPARVALGPPRARRWDGEANLAARLGEAADVARRMGGLPAGALLVVAGLTAPVVPEVGTALAARIEGLGRASASFA